MLPVSEPQNEGPDVGAEHDDNSVYNDETGEETKK